MTRVKVIVKVSSPLGEAAEVFQSAVTQLDQLTARQANQSWHARQELKNVFQFFWPRLVIDEVVAVEEL